MKHVYNNKIALSFLTEDYQTREGYGRLTNLDRAWVGYTLILEETMLLVTISLYDEVEGGDQEITQPERVKKG